MVWSASQHFLNQHDTIPVVLPAVLLAVAAFSAVLPSLALCSSVVVPRFADAKVQHADVTVQYLRRHASSEFKP